MNFSDSLTTELQERWRDDYCPLINGIIHADGWVDQLNIVESPSARSTPKQDYRFEPLERIALAELQTSGKLEWTSCNGLSEVVDEKNDLKLQAGEGGWGGEGFVALSRLSTGNLLWVAHFDTSNPFTEARFEAASIVAVNNHGNLWTFSYPTPRLLSIV